MHIYCTYRCWTNLKRVYQAEKKQPAERKEWREQKKISWSAYCNIREGEKKNKKKIMLQLNLPDLPLYELGRSSSVYTDES